MTTAEKKLLLNQAIKLTTLGYEVESKRKKLKNLVENGVGYDDPKMRKAYDEFTKIDSEWKRLETEHLQLKNKLCVDK